jgi:protocatechuate 3,4-dioxygenase beta subunit
MRIALCIPLITAFAFTPAFGADCSPTPGRTAGTHQKEDVPERIDIGKGVTVSGRILSGKECKPIAGARIQHWQAGKSGEYEDRLRAVLYSDKNGHYRFETEWPNLAYPHIHFRVNASRHHSLDTQWVGQERTSQINFDIVLVPEG